MHIALWSPAWPLERFQNGVVTYVHWMKRELESRGHRVSVFTTELAQEIPEPRVYLVRRRLAARLVRRFARRLFPVPEEIFGLSAVIAAAMLRVHRHDPIDVIEMEESFGWFDGVARLTGIPLLVKLHGPAFLSLIEGEIDTQFANQRVEREGRALARCETIASPSKLTLDQTVERYGLKPKTTWHVVNPVTMTDGIPIWDLKTCEQQTILFVGRFDLRKGADIVLKAFLLLLRQRPSLKLILVGPDTGLPGPDGRKLQFREYIEWLFPAEFRPRVEFRGRLPNHEVAKLRVLAMVTVIASRWENQGYSVLEAMLQGCPVVSTDSGGCPESVVDGVTGRLARSEDPQDFAEKINAVLTDQKNAQDMGRAARQFVIDNHSVARVASQSLQVYESLIAHDAK